MTGERMSMAILIFFTENHKYIAGKSIGITGMIRYNVCMKISQCRKFSQWEEKMKLEIAADVISNSKKDPEHEKKRKRKWKK